MKTQETRLPLFSGFYGTWYEFDDESLDFPLDTIYKVHYKDYMEEVAKSHCSELTDSDIIESIKFKSVWSPREYNFQNDEVDIEITYNEVELLQAIEEYNDSWSEWLADRFTRRSGFIPFYSNSPAEWAVKTKGYTELDGIELHTMLEWYLTEVEELDEEYLTQTVLEANHPSNFVYDIYTPMSRLDNDNLVSLMLGTEGSKQDTLLREYVERNKDGYVGVIWQQSLDRAELLMRNPAELFLESYPENLSHIFKGYYLEGHIDDLDYKTIHHKTEIE